jgi:LisH domain-containing protein ARMC9
MAKWDKMRLDEVSPRLDFYLHVYFTIFPIHPACGRGKEVPLDLIKDYKVMLEKKGNQFSDDPEFVPFFAMAYCQNHLANPSYQPLLKKEWVLEMRNDLIKLLSKFLKGAANVNLLTREGMETRMRSISGDVVGENQPLLVKMFTDSAVGSPKSKEKFDFSKEMKVLEKERDILKGEYEKKKAQCEELNEKEIFNLERIEHLEAKTLSLEGEVQEKQKQLTQNTTMLKETQENWLKFGRSLCGFSRDAIIALEEACDLMPESLKEKKAELVEKTKEFEGKLQHYENFVNQMCLDHFSEDQEEEPVMDLSNVDFEKIKGSLTSFENERRLKILNAIRWKLIQSREAGCFRQAINVVAMADLFDLKTSNGSKGGKGEICVYQSLFLAAPEPIQEAAIWLLRLISASFQGRSYLIQGQSMLQLLCDRISKTKLTEKADRIILIILQRLSLRPAAVSVFLNKEMFRFIVNNMAFYSDVIASGEEDTHQEEIIMQYLVCFLMNILVRKEGRQRGSKMVEQLWSLTHNLLTIKAEDEEGFNLRTHIHGVIYYLIHIPGFKKIALVSQRPSISKVA